MAVLYQFPMGKVKQKELVCQYGMPKMYQFPMGKVKGGIRMTTEMYAIVSIPYGKGKVPGGTV